MFRRAARHFQRDAEEKRPPTLGAGRAPTPQGPARQGAPGGGSGRQTRFIVPLRRGRWGPIGGGAEDGRARHEFTMPRRLSARTRTATEKRVKRRTLRKGTQGQGTPRSRGRPRPVAGDNALKTTAQQRGLDGGPRGPRRAWRIRRQARPSRWAEVRLSEQGMTGRCQIASLTDVAAICSVAMHVKGVLPQCSSRVPSSLGSGANPFARCAASDPAPTVRMGRACACRSRAACPESRSGPRGSASTRGSLS